MVVADYTSYDMSVVTFEERNETSFKSRQTARKSTNSKLKFLPDGTLQPNSDKAVLTNSLIQDTNRPEATLSLKTTKNVAVSLKNINCSDCSENKLAIFSSASTSKANDKDYAAKLDHCKTDAIKIKLKNCNITEEGEQPKSGVSKTLNTSDDSGCSTNMSSNETATTECMNLKLNPTANAQLEEVKPPLKMILSNIKENPTIQKTTVTDSEELKSNIIPTKVNLPQKSSSASETTSGEDDYCSEIVSTGNESSASAVKRLEDVVNNINARKSKFSNASSESDSNTPGKRLNEDPLLITNNVHPKKPKLINVSKEDDTILFKPILPSDIKDIDKDKVKTEAFPKNMFDKMQPELEKYVKGCCQKQIELNAKLQKKNEKYNKLLDKYETLEETFRSWIKFADDLQTRVKKLALHLHKQQETVKCLQSLNSIPKVSASTQTDQISIAKEATNFPQQMRLNRNVTNLINYKAASALNSPVTPGKNASNATKPKADVIDLTNDTELLPSSSSHNSRYNNINTKIQQILQLQENMSNSPKNLQNRTINAPSINKSSSLSSIASLHGVNNGQFSSKDTSTLRYGDQRVATSRQQTNNMPPYQANDLHNIERAQTSRQSYQPRNPSTHRNVTQKSPSSYPPLPSFSTLCSVPRGALGPPPPLTLGIKKGESGIVLSWNNLESNLNTARVVGYELYAYHQSGSNERREWKKIGDDTIAAMDLPMACTLSQFSSNLTYFFAVRGKDEYGRYGPFSKPCCSKDIT